jgi:hypothetical protein
LAGIVGELRSEPSAADGEGDAHLEGACVVDGDDAVRGAAAQFHGDVQGVDAGGVVHGVDAVWGERADPVGEAVTVRHGDRAE